jgi:hypothetical protein
MDIDQQTEHVFLTNSPNGISNRRMVLIIDNPRPRVLNSNLRRPIEVDITPMDA